MKQIYIETKKQSTSAFRGDMTLLQLKSSKIINAGLRNIFLTQNMGKGPPGRTCQSVTPKFMSLSTSSDHFTRIHNLIINKNQIYFTQFLNY